jgi:hypothetical protein
MAGLDDSHVAPLAGQLPRRRKADDAAPDDHDVDVLQRLP